MSRALIGLGSNLGDRAATLSAAIASLGSTPGVNVQATSSWHQTLPVGGPSDQPAFLNAAAVLETSLAPEALLDVLQRIEMESGRRREAHWGPRTLDLDLLLYEDRVIDSPRLVVPHPWLAVRRFALAPAAEIAADWVHPLVGWTLARLLAHLNTAPNYLALCGPPGVGKTRVAEHLAAERGLRLLHDPEPTPIPGDSTPDPARPNWEAWIEYSEHHRRDLLLVSQPWRGPTDWGVSDFWLGQSLAYAALNLTPDAFQHFEALWHNSPANAISPKLLVMLDPPWESLPGPQVGLSKNPPPVPDWIRIREKLLELVFRPGWGPVLRLRSPELPVIVGQLGAAMDAML